MAQEQIDGSIAISEDYSIPIFSALAELGYIVPHEPFSMISRQPTRRFSWQQLQYISEPELPRAVHMSRNFHAYESRLALPGIPPIDTIAPKDEKNIVSSVDDSTIHYMRFTKKHEQRTSILISDKGILAAEQCTDDTLTHGFILDVDPQGHAVGARSRLYNRHIYQIITFVGCHLVLPETKEMVLGINMIYYTLKDSPSWSYR